MVNIEKLDFDRIALIKKNGQKEIPKDSKRI